MSYPETWQLFHDLQLKSSVPRRSAYVRWSEDASLAECQVRAPDDVQITGRIEYEGAEQAHATFTQFDHRTKQWQLMFAPQRTGAHSLWIFARRASDSQTKKSSSVAWLHLSVTKLKRPLTFPAVFDAFHVRKCQIVEPLNGVLKRHSNVRLHGVVPDAKDVRLMADSQ